VCSGRWVRVACVKDAKRLTGAAERCGRLITESCLLAASTE
jgi:hypothetical protein